MAQEVDDAIEEQRDEAVATRGHVLLLLVLCCAPTTLVLVKLGQFGLTFPYWDAWRFAELIEKWNAGHAGFIDFWVQHNEHRILFPRVMMLVLAKLSGWNVAWELGASVVLSFVIFGTLCRMLFRAESNLLARCLGTAILSALVFSWTQNENWVWGFQSNVWLLIATVVVAVAVMSSELAYPVRVGVGVLCAIVATYSYANGLFFWLAALPLLWDTRCTRERRAAGLVVWLIAFGLTAESYFFDYVKPAVSPSLLTALEHPVLFVEFLAAFLGAPVTTFFTMPAWHGVDSPPPMWALIPGPLAVLAFAVLVWRTWARERDWNRLAPWLTLAAFALGSAVVASAGRCGFGLGQALTSRYITITTLFWIALLVLALRALAHSKALEEARTQSLAVGFAAVCVLVSVYGSSTTSAPHEQRCHWKRMGWLAIRAGYWHPLFLGDISDKPQDLADKILPWMRDNKLCGMGVPIADPKGAAAKFLRDAQQLAAMKPQPLLMHAGIYADVASKLDPACPGLAEFQQQLRTATSQTPTSAGSAPQTGASTAAPPQSTGAQ